MLCPLLTLALLLTEALALQPTATALAADRAAKPYDKQLLRLSEVLGGIHYLRALCNAGDGQKWRRQMQDLVSAEGTTPYRRAQLVESFNKGYRSYQRTYRTCTPTARRAIRRFLDEAITIGEALVAEGG